MAVTFDPATKVGGTLSNGNLTWTFTGVMDDGGGVTTNAEFKNLDYCEVYTSQGMLYMGVQITSSSNPHVLDYDGDGNIYYDGGLVLVGSGWSYDNAPHVVQFCIKNGKFYGRVDTSRWNASALADPVTEVGGYTLPFAGPYFINVYAYCEHADTYDLSLRALASSFTYSAPTGFNAYDLGGGGRTADASIAEAGDTLTAAVRLKLQAAASITEAGDTLSATGGAVSGITASAGIAEAGDTASAAGALKLRALASISEGGDALSSAALLKIKAALGLPGAGDTLSADARGPLATITGAVAINQAGDALASACTIFGWTLIPPTDQAWSQIPVNDETWTQISPTAVNWS